MAEVFAPVKDCVLPVVGCLWADTLVFDPISGVVLALLVGKRRFCCRAKISYEAAVCPQGGMLMPER